MYYISYQINPDQPVWGLAGFKKADLRDPRERAFIDALREKENHIFREVSYMTKQTHYPFIIENELFLINQDSRLKVRAAFIFVNNKLPKAQLKEILKMSIKHRRHAIDELENQYNGA